MHDCKRPKDTWGFDKKFKDISVQKCIVDKKPTVWSLSIL